MAGSGVSWARDRIREAGLQEHVEVHGKLSQDELLGLYRGSDVAVVPSVYEEFGYVVLEAMAQGTPVVGSNVHAYEEILGGGASVLTRSSETGRFTDVLRRVLENRAPRSPLAPTGLEHVRSTYSMDVVVPKVPGGYEQTEDQPASAPDLLRPVGAVTGALGDGWWGANLPLA